MMTGEEFFNSIGIDMGWILIGGLFFSLVMFVLIIVLFVQNKKLKQKYEIFMSGEDGKSLEKVIGERFGQIDALKSHMEIVDGRLNSIDGILLDTYKKMALVKYDAFHEIGGGLSFVLILLTAQDDGFILNAMHSNREGCYIYAKEVVKGKCELELSEEEQKALEKAKQML